MNSMRFFYKILKVHDINLIKSKSAWTVPKIKVLIDNESLKQKYALLEKYTDGENSYLNIIR